jgi:hypothetical protein
MISAARSRPRSWLTTTVSISAAGTRRTTLGAMSPFSTAAAT